MAEAQKDGNNIKIKTCDTVWYEEEKTEKIHCMKVNSASDIKLHMLNNILIINAITFNDYKLVWLFTIKTSKIAKKEQSIRLHYGIN